MAEGGPGGEIGKMFVTIEARIAALEAGLKAGEAATAASGKRMGDNIATGVGAGVARASAGFAGKGGFLDGIGNGIKNATSGLRSAVGAITAIVGTASRLLGFVGLISSGVYVIGSAVSAIRSGMAGGADEAKRMEQNLKDSEAVGKRLQEIAEETARETGKPNVNPDILDPAKRNKLDADIKRAVDDIAAKDAQTREAQRLYANPRTREDREIRKAVLDRLAEERRMLEKKLDELEKKRIQDDTVRNRVFKDVIELATQKILAVQKEQTNKLLESIALDSARARQIAEEMQNSQHRGP